ncbi:hypothetical protein [Streptomyces sp. NPDC012510]|uniref:hypothetical protein n=1 Tax=Streptomyces sp. NPDC012510 TaxID=3364838 RepID=UPI0036E8510C
MAVTPFGVIAASPMRTCRRRGRSCNSPPYDAEETVTRPLNEPKREHLDVCEQALRRFRKSAIVAGEALEVISRGRLLRDTQATFVEYLDDVWDNRKSLAFRPTRLGPSPLRWR